MWYIIIGVVFAIGSIFIDIGSGNFKWGQTSMDAIITILFWPLLVYAFYKAC